MGVDQLTFRATEKQHQGTEQQQQQLHY